jgi:hypothetical protein
VSASRVVRNAHLQSVQLNGIVKQVADQNALRFNRALLLQNQERSKQDREQKHKVETMAREERRSV